MKVLIAEDNAIWRQMLKQNVSSWGYEPVVAEDGKEAWKILQRRRAAAGRARLANAEHGRNRCVPPYKSCQTLPFTYVVVLTSRDADEDMVAGLNARADDYLTKPVEPKVLRSRLAAAQRIVEAVPPREWALPRIPAMKSRGARRRAIATVWEAIQNGSGSQSCEQNHPCRSGDRRSVQSFRPRDSHRRAARSSPHRPHLRQPDRRAHRLLRDGVDRRIHVRQVRQVRAAEGR